MRHSYILLFVFLLLSVPIQAKHIIGGVMYYEFAGQSGNLITYRITLKMYRDCKPEANKANFDGLIGEIPALGTIYRGNGVLPIAEINFGTPIVKKLDVVVTNKCLVVPPGICVEEGIYTTTIQLPVSTSSYYIVYQRCCRNNTITNIVRPGDVGSTFMVEITPSAQSLQNSSPQFKYFPPIAICANFPLEFDHSATDVDGDSLVYSLCAPFVGGGNDDMGTNGCNVVAPQPDCPPPFEEVTFRNPYSPQNPLGGPTPLSIDPATGFLKGTPGISGQFVVGICLREYRNGNPISEIRRDFQFNVTSCEKTVDAVISAAGMIGKDLDIKLCGDKYLDVAFAGQVTNDIFDLQWSFSHNNNVTNGTGKDYRLNTEDLGQYFGTLYLNRGLPCSDSTTIKVNVFPDIRADFTFDYDTCYGKVINFTNMSVSDAGPIISSEWKANGRIFANSFNAQFNTLEPDFYDMILVVSDQNQCIDSVAERVAFFPIPRDELFDPGGVIGCEPFTYQFKKPNSYITDKYIIDWKFGDGQSGSGVSPEHTYQNRGIYTVDVTVTNVFGCTTSATFNNTITVLQSPVAGFTFEPSNPSNLEPTITIHDESSHASSWLYEFGTGDNSTDRNPIYTYRDTGIYHMVQWVSHENGCRDSLAIIVDVSPRYTLYLPNVINISSNSGNDLYGPVGIPYGVRDFRMAIFDRWGNEVYSTEDFNGRWDGKNKVGDVLPKGVYSVKIDLTEPRGKKKTIYGKAVLIQ